MNTNNTEQYRQELNEYLQNKEATFAEGFDLMVKFSPKISLIHMLARKSTKPAMREKLDYELGKIAKLAVIKLSPYVNKGVVAKVQPVTAQAEVSPADKVLNERLKVVTTKMQCTVEEMPEPIREAWNKAREYYHKYHHYHTQMKVVESDEERAECVKFAKEYEDLNAQMWLIIDEWAAAGKPNVEKPSADDDVIKAVGSAKSYISREAAKLDKKQGKAYEHLKGMLKDKVAVLVANDIEIPKKNVDVLKKHGIVG